MKNFVFYTPDGYTTDFNNNDIENLQILGFTKGQNPQNAFENFKSKNKWLNEYNFNEIISKEVSQEEFYFSLK